MTTALLDAPRSHPASEQDARDPPGSKAADLVARYPHRQSLSDWLAALATQLPASDQLLRALPLVEGSWNGAERLALHERLWTLWRAVNARTHEAAATQLDGRHAPWCELLAQDWSAPATAWRLARAHLVWPARHAAPSSDLRAPAAPDYVQLLLNRPHIADTAQARWYRLCAGLQIDDARLDSLSAADLGDQALAIAEAGGMDGRDGLALLFELAVRSGDSDRATFILAQSIAASGAEEVAPRWLRRWIEGPHDPAALPLALDAAFEATWLRPARLSDPDWRAALAGALRRRGPSERLQALNHTLGVAHIVRASNEPAWKMLSALDGAYALAETGALSEPSVAALRATQGLAASADAALACQLARQYAAAGRAADAARELAIARAGAGGPDLSAQLADLMATMAPDLAAPLCARLRDPAPHTPDNANTGAPQSATCANPELAAWEALADAPHPSHHTSHHPSHHPSHHTSPARTVAQAMLARASLHGRLDARHSERRPDLADASRRWQALLGDPAHAAEARAALDDPRLRWHAAWAADGPGRPHLYVPPREPSTGEWLIVPSCLDSRHTYTQVDSLVRALPGHHLVFINNPEFNWYSDAVFEGLRTLVCERILTHAAPAQVCCYFGSMGGTAALKLALAFGLRAIVFNPQTDLDLWAAFRPRERARLWAAERDRAPADWPDAAWSAAPVYVACGSGTADRLALQVLIARWRTLAHATLIVEKFADPHHAGLIRRITPGPVPAVVVAASRRLTSLATATGCPEGFIEIAPSRQPDFWDILDAEASLKTEIVLRAGQLFVRASDRCATG